MIASPTLYKQIEKQSPIKEYLHSIFDFDMIDMLTEPYLLSTTGYFKLSHDLVALGQNGTGSYYTIIKDLDPDQSPVLFIGSEWQYGRVANNFSDFLLILLDLPDWLSFTYLSDSETLEDVRKRVLKADKNFVESEPEAISARGYIKEKLNLPKNVDPLLKFYAAAVKSTDIQVTETAHNTAYENFSNRLNHEWLFSL